MSSGPGSIYFQGCWRKRTHEEDGLETFGEVRGGSGEHGVSEVKQVEKFRRREGSPMSNAAERSIT